MIRSVQLIIQRAGFKVVGCGGYANSAALLGAPDIESLTLTEMVDAASGLPMQRICRCSPTVTMATEIQQCRSYRQAV